MFALPLRNSGDIVIVVQMDETWRMYSCRSFLVEKRSIMSMTKVIGRSSRRRQCQRSTMMITKNI
jgi:hypothetical protein